MNCKICGCFVGERDALPFDGGRIHFRCAAKASLPSAGRTGKVLVMVVKKGPAFERAVSR